MRAIFYHGVVDGRERQDYFSTLFADVNDFEHQVRQVARNWRPMGLSEIYEHLEQHRPLPPRAVHISFDDGYRNVLTAAEVLDHHHVPWTLFVVSDAVLDGFRPWFSRLADVLANSTWVRRPDGSSVPLSTWEKTWAFDRMVKAQVLTVPTAQMEPVLEAVLELPGLNTPAPERWPYLKLDELRQLQNAGVEIGNHSARHVNLQRCSDGELESEVDESRSRLEAALGVPVRFFAYPDGRFNRRVIHAISRSHDLAMAALTIRAPADRLALRRFPVQDTSPDVEAILGSYPGGPVGACLRTGIWEWRARAYEALYRVAPRTAPLSRRV